MVAGFATWVGWVASTMLKHATILATLVAETKQLPQIQDDVRVVSAQVAEVRLEQAKLSVALTGRGRR